jgi:uncharacterized RDD family membrane protein YckC
MSQIAINTSQNVNINFNIASVGERMLAFIIDLLIRVAILSLSVFVFQYSGFGIFA